MRDKQFLDQFKYNRGVVFIDGWQFLNDGESGDCDDFALTMSYYLAGGWLMLIWNILTFKTVFWMVKSPKNKFFPRHMVLYQRGKGWIDSSNRYWRNEPAPHKLMWPMLFPWVFFRIIWGTIAKLFSR